MMTSILNFLTLFKKPLSIGLGIVLLLAVAWGGYSYASSKWEAKYADLERSIATQTAKEQEEYAQRLSVALSERDSAISKWTDTLNDNTRLAERVRILSSRQDSGTSNTAKPDNEQLEGCKRLLAEGVGLVEESIRLVVQTSVDKDALSKIVEEK